MRFELPEDADMSRSLDSGMLSALDLPTRDVELQVPAISSRPRASPCSDAGSSRARAISMGGGSDTEQWQQQMRAYAQHKMQQQQQQQQMTMPMCPRHRQMGTQTEAQAQEEHPGGGFGGSCLGIGGIPEPAHRRPCGAGTGGMDYGPHYAAASDAYGAQQQQQQQWQQRACWTAQRGFHDYASAGTGAIGTEEARALAEAHAYAVTAAAPPVVGGPFRFQGAAYGWGAPPSVSYEQHPLGIRVPRVGDRAQPSRRGACPTSDPAGRPLPSSGGASAEVLSAESIRHALFLHQQAFGSHVQPTPPYGHGDGDLPLPAQGMDAHAASTFGGAAGRLRDPFGSRNHSGAQPEMLSYISSDSRYANRRSDSNGSPTRPDYRSTAEAHSAEAIRRAQALHQHTFGGGSGRESTQQPLASYGSGGGGDQSAFAISPDRLEPPTSAQSQPQQSHLAFELVCTGPEQQLRKLRDIFGDVPGLIRFLALQSRCDQVSLRASVRACSGAAQTCQTFCVLPSRPSAPTMAVYTLRPDHVRDAARAHAEHRMAAERRARLPGHQVPLGRDAQGECATLRAFGVRNAPRIACAVLSSAHDRSSPEVLCLHGALALLRSSLLLRSSPRELQVRLDFRHAAELGMVALGGHSQAEWVTPSPQARALLYGRYVPVGRIFSGNPHQMQWLKETFGDVATLFAFLLTEVKVKGTLPASLPPHALPKGKLINFCTRSHVHFDFDNATRTGLVMIGGRSPYEWVMVRAAYVPASHKLGCRPICAQCMKVISLAQ
jgi:hypothetical protein